MGVIFIRAVLNTYICRTPGPCGVALRQACNLVCLDVRPIFAMAFVGRVSTQSYTAA